MERNLKDKNCEACGNLFHLTSPSQKRCPECIVAGKKSPETQFAPLVPQKLNFSIRETLRVVMDQIGATSVTFTITK